MELRQCILTKNDCYKKGTKIVPKGIVVHSTGANNPNLRRYIQPDDGLLGVNNNHNDWNRSGVAKCVHGFIGKDKNGNVQAYQTLPFNIAAWGVGNGSKGSYNYNPAYIQFEICEDGLNDEKYFNEAFNKAIELCAYLCKEYNLSIDNIVSHNEASKRGYASNHKDCDHWLKNFGKNMDWFRSEVKARLNDKPSENTYIVQKGDNLNKIAKKFNTSVDELVKLNNIKDPNKISVGQVLILPTTNETKPTPIPAPKPTTIKIEDAKSFNKKYKGGKSYKTTDDLRLRAGAGTDSAIIGVLPKGTKVTWYGFYTGSWKLVKVMSGNLKGKTGYCSQNYLK